MAVIRLVRHGHAAAGFAAAADPGLDERGRAQAVAMAEVVGPLGPLPLVTSPLLRTRQTAAVLEVRWGCVARVEPRVAEIPSPTDDLAERGAWLSRAMAGTWADLGPSLETWRDGLVAALLELTDDTVVVTHFVAINAVVGWAGGDDRVMVTALDNCSVTTIETAGPAAVGAGPGAAVMQVRQLGATATTEVA